MSHARGRDLGPVAKGNAEGQDQSPAARWAQELQHRNLQLFSLAEKTRVSRVRSGDIWDIAPDGSYVVAQTEDKSVECYGTLQNGSWVPCEEQPRGPQVAKLIVVDRPGFTPRLKRIGFRPGIILGEPYSSDGANVAYRAGTLLDQGFGIFIPGSTKSFPVHGELEILYSRQGMSRQKERWSSSQVGPPKGYFQHLHAWGIGVAPGRDLLRLRLNLDQCSAGRGRHNEHAPHAASKRLLAELIGIIPTRAWTPDRRGLRNRPLRGELIKVFFTPDSRADPIPCVVVSPNDLNCHPVDVVVVLRALPFEDCDPNDDPLAIPLGPNGKLERVAGAWSIAVQQVRGIKLAREVIERYNPPLLLDRDWFDALEDRLRVFYG